MLAKIMTVERAPPPFAAPFDRWAANDEVL